MLPSSAGSVEEFHQMGVSVMEIGEMGFSGFSRRCAISEMGFVWKSARDKGVGM